MIRNNIFILILVLYSFDFTWCLSCLKCNSMERNCGLTVTRVYDVSTENCQSHCYIRTNSTGIIKRGCADGFSYASESMIPDNGCAIRNNEYWCWCNEKNFCNDDNIRITLIDPNSEDSCNALKCLNGGACVRNVYSGDKYFCLCPDKFTGSKCENKIN
ncbi:unnamed protein product [Brachionus calyciflorus]|uniref:EGF-like domain-containing protein n=1 Tax=Brachionus calyciflorus TaxID=104777 RepID=A0A814KXG6_9BILA|nr:unnamed protein product [Brachionus calyciflorus]